MGPFLASLSPPGSLSLGSCLSFHLPLIPLEAGLTQEPPKQGPDQCYTPARTLLTVATWGLVPFTPLDTGPWAEPQEAALRDPGPVCEVLSPKLTVTGGGGQDGPGPRGSGSGVWEAHSGRSSTSDPELSPQGPVEEAGGYRSAGRGGREVGLERWGIPSPGRGGHSVLPAPQAGAFAGEAELAARLQGAQWWPQTCSHPEL